MKAIVVTDQAAGTAGMKLVERPGPQGSALAGLSGAPLDAVDAEHQVEERAPDRRQPGETDPARGGGDLALAQKHMGGDAQGQDDAERRHHGGENVAHVGPEPFGVVGDQQRPGSLANRS